LPDSERGLRVVWSSLEFIGGGSTVRCAVTLEGSFHESMFNKVARTPIADITRASLSRESCSGGTASMKTETLPWSMDYMSFVGPLPGITSVGLRLVNAGMSITPSGSVTCSVRTTDANPSRASVAVAEAVGSLRRATAVRADETATIPLEGGFLCSLAGNGTMAGTGTPTVVGGTAAVPLTLSEGELGVIGSNPSPTLIIEARRESDIVYFGNIARLGSASIYLERYGSGKKKQGNRTGKGRGSGLKTRPGARDGYSLRRRKAAES